MFTLTALAAALQGIGYSTLLTALQGLLAVTITPEPLPIGPAGSMGAIRARKRIRRLLPSAWEDFAAELEIEDEELLLEVGAL